jgi:CTP-dependent riboflavin kinase
MVNYEPLDLTPIAGFPSRRSPVHRIAEGLGRPTTVRMKVTGRITHGVGDFRVRMVRFADVFERAVGEPLFPGTLNVDIQRPLRIHEDFRIPGSTIGERGQDLLFERCLVAGYRAYRIQPYELSGGAGGHGDHILEIASVMELRPLLVGREDIVEIEFYRDG